MVAYCEKEGGQIPRYEIKEDYDIIDTVIKDLKIYTKSLVYEDKALATEIEDYLKRREIQESMKRDREKAKEQGLTDVQIEDKDVGDYNQFLKEQSDADAALEERIAKEEEEE